MTRDELRLSFFKEEIKDEMPIIEYIEYLENFIINDTQKELDMHFAEKGIR